MTKTRHVLEEDCGFIVCLLSGEDICGFIQRKGKRKTARGYDYSIVADVRLASAFADVDAAKEMRRQVIEEEPGSSCRVAKFITAFDLQD